MNADGKFLLEKSNLSCRKNGILTTDITYDHIY